MHHVTSQALCAARAIRVRLLSRPVVERGLGGQCALASMLLTEAIGDVAVFRTGFFMKTRRLYGRRGRYPHPHAWCQVGKSIIDVTATQFGRFPAIYVVAATDTDRYIERADGAQAIDAVMKEWLLDQVAEYRALRRRLRAMDDAIA